MTKPKGPSRRVGPADWRDDPEAAPYRRTRSDVVESARWAFMLRVAALVPEVLQTLASLPSDDRPDADAWREQPEQAALGAWAGRWGLDVGWARAHARATWRALRARPDLLCWAPRDDEAGALLDENDEATPSAPRPLKDLAHVDALVAVAVQGRHYDAIHAPTVVRVGERKTDGGWRRRSGPRVRRDVHAVAALIGLPLRTLKRGRRPI